MNNTNTFSKFAIVFGVCSVILASSVVLGLVAGGLAVIFAVLSKQEQLKMSKYSKIGFYSGIIGMLASAFITVNTIYMYKTDADYRNKVNEEFKSVYGQTLDEYMDETFKSFSGE